MSRKARTMLAAAAAIAVWIAPARGMWAQETPPAGTPQHEVRRGDTLWDLSGRYLSSPYRWPEIYELNRDVVQDPHWIYPGEWLRIPGGGVVPVMARPGGTPTGTGRPAPATDLSNTVFAQRSDRLLSHSSLEMDDAARKSIVSPSDFFHASLLLQPAELGPAGATARVVEENPLELNLPPSARLNQQVVVWLGSLAAAPGDLLQSVRWGREIGSYGELMESMAILQVSRVEGDSARARVVEVYGNYQVGDPVVRAADFFLDPEAEMTRAAEPIRGRIIEFAVENQTVLDLYDEVFLDVGQRDGVRVGDEFLAFSHLEPSPDTALAEDALCVLRVVRTTEGTSTAVVYRIRDPGTREGNPVRLERRIAG